MEVETIDLTDSLAAAVDLLATQAAAQQIEFITFIDPQLPQFLTGNKRDFNQILTNFLAQLIQGTENSEIFVALTLDSDTETTATLHFSAKVPVIDLSLETLKKILSVSPAEKPESIHPDQGTYLDFRTAQSSIKKMQGEMGVETISDQAINFWFKVPFLKSPLPQSSHPEFSSSLSILSTLKNRRLLIIDAQETQRKLLQTQTRAWGMTVDTATNSLQALNQLHLALEDHHPYEVVILDDQMPDIPGIILAKLIKADLVLAPIKIILLTANQDGEATNKDADSDLIVSLKKPIQVSELRQSLASFFESKRSLTETPNHPDNQSPELSTHQESEPGKNDSLSAPAALKILLVEDNFINRKIALNQLGILGYQADYVTNGQEALDVLAQKSYDVVLMDCQMPVLDGFAATREIRKKEGNAHHTIVIAMTANAMQEDRDRCLTAGMDDYLSKPVSVQELERILKTWNPKNSLEIQTDSSSKILQSASEIPAKTKSVSPDIINLKRLQEISDGDSEFAQELMQNFLSECDLKITEMKQAFLTQNLQQIENIAHWLKGASGNVGISSLQAQCSQLESFARQQKINESRELLTPIEQFLADVKTFVMNHFHLCE